MHGTLRQQANWRSIRLELAPTSEFPAGSVSRAYLIRLPLNDNDLIDEAALRHNPQWATVRRHWSTEADEAGFVRANDQGWAFHCDAKPDRVLKLDGQALRLGQQVHVVGRDGVALPFRIASIR